MPESKSSKKSSRRKRRGIIGENYDTINAIRRLIAMDKELTRTRLASEMGLSLATISRDTRELMDEGAIEESESGCIVLKPDFAYFLGIQVSAGHVRVTLLDFTLQPVYLSDKSVQKKLNIDDGTVHKLWRWDPTRDCVIKDEDSLKQRVSDRTEYYEKKSFLFFKTLEEKSVSLGDEKDSEQVKHKVDGDNEYKAIRSAINYITKQFLEIMDGYPLVSVGVITPGIMDRQGIVRLCPSIRQLETHSPRELINIERFRAEDVEVTFEHEAEGIVQWVKEYFYKQGDSAIANKPNIAAISVSDEVRAAYILNNEIYRGASNLAGEIGHYLAPDHSDSSKLGELRKAKFNEDSDSNRALHEEPEQKPASAIGRDTLQSGKGGARLSEINTECLCGKICVEKMIRDEIFDSQTEARFFEQATKSQYKEESDKEKITKYFQSRPRRLELFKELVRTLGNQVINSLNVDVLVLVGRIVSAVEDSFYDNTLHCDSVHNIAKLDCKVYVIDKYIESAVCGAAIAAYHKCSKDNLGRDKPVRVIWKSLGSTERD